MVSLRCRIAVAEILRNSEINYLHVNLGMVQVPQSLSTKQHDVLKKKLNQIGLVLIEDKESIIIDKIKNTVREIVLNTEELPITNYSTCISDKINLSYTYLSNLFTKINGITIRQFIILNKIEKAKELLLYNELNLTEISYKLNYSSVAHLSTQFKKVTGFTPSIYKSQKQQRNLNVEYN